MAAINEFCQNLLKSIKIPLDHLDFYVFPKRVTYKVLGLNLNSQSLDCP